MKTCAILLAAGSGKRMEMDTNKVLIEFENESAVIRCLKTFEQAGLFSDIIVVCRKEELDLIRQKAGEYAGSANYFYCEGGAERQHSVSNALLLVPEDVEIVAVHDAARCFVTPEIIRDCVSSAVRFGSGVAAVSATDTIKRAHRGVVLETLPREELVIVQTPQAFRKELLLKAHKKAEEDGFLGTDDASLVERLPESVRIVRGSKENIKLTTKEDLIKGKEIIEDRKLSDIRIGNGFDMHAFADGRKLVLGGVGIPNERGLEGHSDADVLIHAIMDALLGAARLGDIGELFPPTDPQYKDIDSVRLLREVGGLLKKYGYKIINIDSTIIMQAPKVADYRMAMAENIAEALLMDAAYINVKATTTERLGTLGRGEGAAAQAVCIIQKVE
ncbi:MAG: 2-C-methyl-D-erythritol 4-phosphate cytidylyltransferase [Christensenellaceae bacterium]|jgi:2-C-methyl-D-erythritol 4-phosphate cytidylyltransferase/2-C-methyl-D-erythritol 2,4-cyclodiphosphate synthase